MRLALACALLMGADHAARSEAKTHKNPAHVPSGSAATESETLDQHDSAAPNEAKQKKLLQWTMKGNKLSGVLRNSDDPTAPEALKECDPSTISADLGILSCGVNQYCAESRQSSLGGVCVPNGNIADSRTLQSTTFTSSSLLVTTIQQRRDHDYLLKVLSEACGQTNYCDCTGFDITSFTGIVECTKMEEYCSQSVNYCGEDVELCYSLHLTLEASGRDQYSYTKCMTYTSPYQQRVCTSYSTADPSACVVDFNNDMCQSCTPELRTYKSMYEIEGQSHEYSYSQRCFQFDCTDTAGEHTGNSCDRNVATIRHNIMFGDDCARCQPCGVGFKMTKLDNFGDFPIVGHYQCSGLELGSMIGYFDRQLCNEIQAAAFDTCGCEPLFYDPIIVKTPRIPSDENESCFICGKEEAVVTLPNQNVILPEFSMSCGELATAGVMGQFSATYCQDEVQPRAHAVCRCAKTLLPDSGIVFHDGSSTAATAPSSTPSPMTAGHSAAEGAELNGRSVCAVCPNGYVANPDLFVRLHNGMTTCAGLEAAGYAGLFDTSYCLETVVHLALENDCCSNSTLLDDSFLNATAMDDDFYQEPNFSPSVTSPIATFATKLPTPSPTEIGLRRLEPEDTFQFSDIADNTASEETEKAICHVCGEDGTVADPTKFVTFENGISTCGELAEAGLSGVFTQSFCESEAKVIATFGCGCTVAEPVKVTGLSATVTHQQYPTEVNVGEDYNSIATSQGFTVNAALISGMGFLLYMLA
ncbi:hypothetical protein IV203_006901 [Nitzschia inconspicua]|uniref:Uncharacterized protein n=1 Tax=Nitzschia inconspicua TaxID=303405 RepID=A0A9K3KDM1_9STRA|nr:hypothetical protein IV203_006901 [Nitzschia inconspicua]